MLNKTSQRFWVHPILLGLYPVLALYVFNRNEIVFPAIQQAVITSLLIAAIIMIIFLLMFRSWQRAAIHASFTLLWFFSYGHIFDLAKNINFLGGSIGHRIFFPFWILLFVVGQIILLRLKNPIGLNRTLDLISLFLIIFLVVQLLGSFVQEKLAEREFAQKESTSQNISSADSSNRDVYYILVDAYSRSDLLMEGVHLDTSDFISELKKLGFYIPDCAQSNYDSTLPSMTATLSMEYLDALGIYYPADKMTIAPYLQRNLVMKHFKMMGYSTVAFKSLYPWMEQEDVTYSYDYFKDASGMDSQAALNFQYLFLRTTLVRPLIQLLESNRKMTVPPFLSLWIPVGNTLNSRNYRQYQQNVFALDTLQKMPDLPGKKFVYAHLLVTHQPFVFYPDGRFHPFLAQDYTAYRDQVIFANKRLLEIVKDLIAKSKPAPIIVIQGDHSYFDGANRVKILNAYYFPEGGEKALYPTVTPVNTFRLIFNTYFGGQYPLLPDVSRYLDAGDVLREASSSCVT
jgi:sulfatase-like protein